MLRDYIPSLFSVFFIGKTGSLCRLSVFFTFCVGCMGSKTDFLKSLYFVWNEKNTS